MDTVELALPVVRLVEPVPSVPTIKRRMQHHLPRTDPLCRLQRFEIPSRYNWTVKVLFRLDMDTGGCASGRLGFQYELISLTVVTTGNRPAKGYQFHLDFISILEAALVAELASSMSLSL